LSKLPWEEVVKDRRATFPFLRDIFAHMIFVVDAYINYGLQGNTKYGLSSAPHIPKAPIKETRPARNI